MEKSLYSSSYTKTSVTVCAQSGRRLHGHTRVVEHATVEPLGQWCSGRSNATPRWDAVSSGRRRESCYGRRVAGARPTPHRPRDLGQGYWTATATGDEIWCTERQNLHIVTSSVSWSIVLLESEEVSCYTVFSMLETSVFEFHFFKQLLLKNCAMDFFLKFATFTSERW